MSLVYARVFPDHHTWAKHLRKNLDKSPKPARKSPKARPSPPEYRTLKPEPARIPNLKAGARPISEICGPTHHYVLLSIQQYYYVYQSDFIFLESPYRTFTERYDPSELKIITLIKIHCIFNQCSRNENRIHWRAFVHLATLNISAKLRFDSVDVN